MKNKKSNSLDVEKIDHAIQHIRDTFPFEGYLDGSTDSYRSIVNSVAENLTLGSKILDLGCGPAEKPAILQKLGFDCIQNLAKLSVISVVKNFPPDMNHVPFQVVGDIKILLKVKIDKNLEVSRLQKEIDKLTLELVKVEEKLSNKSFVEKAPEKIVNSQKEKRTEYTMKISELNERLDSINL